MKNIIPSILFFSLLYLSTGLNKYSLSNIKYLDPNTKTHLEGDLTFKNPSSFDPTEYSSSRLRNPQNIKLITDLHLSLSLEFDDILHIKITDQNNIRWEPRDILNRNYIHDLNNYSPKKSLEDIGLTLYNESFGFDLINQQTGNIFYKFSNNTFLFSDTLIIFESFLSSDNIYGFGERSHEFKLNDGIYTIWPNDTGGIKYDHGRGGRNGYGHQPIGLHKANEKNLYLGFAFINTNMQDVEIQKINLDRTSLKHLTIGGIIDYYIIIGNSPDNVLKRIHYLIGIPALPPYWSLGWHHSRYGYKNEKEFENVHKNYISNGIPIDTMWIDIDSLDNFKIFTLNKTDFPNLPSIIDSFHQQGTKFVPIVDLGISAEGENTFVYLGNQLDAFIKSNYTKKNLVSNVWPGKTLFPDFFNPNTSLLWNHALVNYEKLVHFDGIWLDMNEPAMINPDKCIGEVADECLPKDNYYYYKELPYLPGYLEKEHIDLGTSSLNENALFYGENERIYTAYNAKPMISYIQSQVTYDYLFLSHKRPFILTRGNSIGIGKYAFHWLGDNFSNLSSMKYGISTIFTFNIFGIPMTGDDICGFFDNTNDNLCARWHNLGAFYPFSRNHNFIYSKGQEPYNLGKNTLNAAKNAIRLRYSILRYMYSELFQISLNEKGSFFKPVLFEYPEDPESYNDIDSRIMVGSSFILFPVLSLETQSFKVTFPDDNWNQFPSGKPFLTKGEGKNKEVLLEGDYQSIHLFMRGGYIVPYQETNPLYIQNTEILRNKPTEIIINPDPEGNAHGNIFYDNDDPDTIQRRKFFRGNLNFSNGVLTMKWNKNKMKRDNYLYKDNIVSKITLLRYSMIKESFNLKSEAVVNVNNENKKILIQIDKENDKAYIEITKNLGKIEFEKINKVSFTQ